MGFTKRLKRLNNRTIAAEKKQGAAKSTTVHHTVLAKKVTEQSFFDKLFTKT
jgi:hypothetical protein